MNYRHDNVKSNKRQRKPGALKLILQPKNKDMIRIQGGKGGGAKGEGGGGTSHPIIFII